MRKTLKPFLAGVLTFFISIACTNEKEPYVEPDTGLETDESYYAGLATISSNDPMFTATEEGGDILFPFSGGTVTVDVNCGCEWNATNVGGSEWLSLNHTTSSLTVSADPLDDVEGRATEIVLATASEGIKFATINVSQTEVVFINLSMEMLVFPNTASSASITVETNFEWDYSYDKAAGWFSLEKVGDEIFVSVKDYDEGNNRESIVTVTAGNNSTGTADAEFTILQTGNALIMTYTITSANTLTRLPLYGTVNCTVDWGDGSSVETVTSTEPSHTFATPGEYDVTVSGTLTALYSKDISTSNNPLPITAVKQWGQTGLTDMQYAFYNCCNLISLPEYTGNVFANVTSFRTAFYNCSSLKEIPAELFANCKKVTTFMGVFESCHALSEIPSNLFDGCTEATDFSYIFYDCTYLKTISPERVFADCAKASTFFAAFYNCPALLEIPAGLFDDCHEVTTFSSTFYGCSSLKTIPQGLFASGSKVTTFQSLFYSCTNLTEIPAGLFDNCPLVTSFQSIFSFCSALLEIPARLFDNCQLVKTFYAAFQCCENSLTEIPAGLFDKCSEVTDFGFTFSGCNSLQAIPSGLFDNCPLVSSFSCVFQACFALKEIPAGLFDNCTEVTDFQTAFYNCNTLTELPEGLFDNCTKAETFDSAFQYCTNLTKIPKGLFDNCDKVMDFEFVFANCISLKTIPKGLFDNCTKVESFYCAFSGCSALEEIPNGLFNGCTEVTTFRSVFSNCTSLSFVPTDLFSKNLKVKNFTTTFNNCTSLTGESPYVTINGENVHLYERSDHTDNFIVPTDYNNCFNGCTGLTDYYKIPSSWGGGGN